MRRPLALTALGLLITFTLAYIVLQPAGVPPELAEVGAMYDVEILRDTWGVPHVFGKTDADAAYGLAYAHAEDDFATIQGALLAARGQLASVYGQGAAPNDYMVHLLRVWDVVAAGYPGLDPATRALCDAYADGLNHYAALHPDAALPDLYPVRGEDVVAGFVHKVPLFFGLDATLQDLFSETRQEQGSPFIPQPDTAAVPIGSNAIAVAPSRTADGSTFLAVNSHQPWTGPVAWYEAHVHSDEGWDMVGSLFPGAPIILHGHNRHLGWAHTVNHPDLIDVFVLDIDPDDPNRYRLDGEWHDLEVRQAPIEVNLWGPFSWTFEREVLWSAYGPVVRQGHGTYAIRFAGFGEVGQVEQWYRMNKATTFADWQDAARLIAVPMFNTVYADQEGEIYYLYNGRLPLRAPGYDWTQYLPGDTHATRWTDTLPFDGLPQVLNPSSGFLQNANSTPFQTTLPPDNPDPAAYPTSFGIETHMTNRALRAMALFGSDDAITWEEFLAYKYDMAYASTSRMGQLVEYVLNASMPADSLTQVAVRYLSEWDLQTNPENPYAALPMLAFRAQLTNFTTALDTTNLLPALRDAAQHLLDHFGRLNVPWGEINRLRRGDVDLPVGGGPDILHAIYGDLQADGRLAGRAGDSYILMVAWDDEGRVRSESIHPFGSATLDATSPHYADQAPPFAERRLKPVWMDEADIRANLERAYRPGQ